MTKHLADHQNTSESARKKYFWAMERHATEAAPHPAIKALSKRPQPRSDAQRLLHFLRIERGHLA